jgi:hypothetical protein
MQSYPSELDIVAAQFVAEHTGGDEFLVDQAVSHLAGRRGDWTSNVEQVLEELTEAPDVIDAVRERIGFLDTQSRSELTKLLVFQRLVRPADRTESEHLWLAGIAQCLDLGSGKQCVCVASPLIETVLRRITQRDAPGTVALSEDLCFQHGSLAATAYRRLAEVETLLRNLVVTMWYAEAGDNWSQRLDEIKTLSREQEQSQEVRELVDLVREALAASGVPLEGMTGSPTPTDGTQEPRPKQSIRQSAESWRQRQTTHHGVELARDNLLQFLTTEALMSVLVNKKFGLHGPGKPFRLEYLVTALEEYIAIRSAVAHNQAVKISTISRLDDLHRRFVEWVTVFADSENQRTRSPPP